MYYFNTCLKAFPTHPHPVLRLRTIKISVLVVTQKVLTPTLPPTWTSPPFSDKLSSAPSLRPRREQLLQQFQFLNTQIAKL